MATALPRGSVGISAEAAERPEVAETGFQRRKQILRERGVLGVFRYGAAVPPARAPDSVPLAAERTDREAQAICVAGTDRMELLRHRLLGSNRLGQANVK